MPGSILAVILVCALSVAGPDCDRSTAVDVVTQPAESVPACMLVGETIAAQSLGPPAPGTYHKIGCERRKIRN